MGLFSRGGDRTRAGLFMFAGVMQYVELVRDGSSYSLELCVDIPYETETAGGELFSSQQVIEDNLRRLRKEVGRKWPKRLSVGIQSKDVLLRTVELPQMDIDDIKSAFKFEFDRYFPIPVDDAVYDVSLIDRPQVDEIVADAVSYCLASAVRRMTVENLMLAAQKVGLKIFAIEPAPIAALRCLMGPSTPFGFNVYALAGATSSMMIASYRDNGIIFRNTSQSFVTAGNGNSAIQGFARDLKATVTFAATQMRGFTPEMIYLGGYGVGLGDAIRRVVENVAEATTETVNPWRLWSISGTPRETYGWEIPLGLALR